MKKLMHLQCEDTMGNKSTIICRLKEGSIRWAMYGGWGSSGTPFSMRNISFYELTAGGNMKWDDGISLPVENLEGETLEEFKARSLGILKYSTAHVKKEVSTEVTFA